MKKVYLLSKVDEGKCVGDRFCENVCPTRAIRMENKKAVVDGTKCAGCLHCLDACGEGAIMVLERQEPLILGVGTTEMDPAKIGVTTKQGQTYVKRAGGSAGRPGQLPFDAYERKFRDCASFAIKPPAGEKVDELITRIKKLEQLNDIGELVELLS